MTSRLGGHECHNEWVRVDSKSHCDTVLPVYVHVRPLVVRIVNVGMAARWQVAAPVFVTNAVRTASSLPSVLADVAAFSQSASNSLSRLTGAEVALNTLLSPRARFHPFSVAVDSCVDQLALLGMESTAQAPVEVVLTEIANAAAQYQSAVGRFSTCAPLAYHDIAINLFFIALCHLILLYSNEQTQPFVRSSPLWQGLHKAPTVLSMIQSTPRWSCRPFTLLLLR